MKFNYLLYYLTKNIDNQWLAIRQTTNFLTWNETLAIIISFMTYSYIYLTDVDAFIYLQFPLTPQWRKNLNKNQRIGELALETAFLSKQKDVLYVYV